MLLGGEKLQQWCQFKSQVKGLPILGVFDEDEEGISEEDKDDKEKGENDDGQSSAHAFTPAGINKDTYSS
eukprot:11490947-Ditylum_brightwellii.AAC.1